MTQKKSHSMWKQATAAAGMCIDFYGRFQSESVRKPGWHLTHAHTSLPMGGSSVGVDTIGLMRGAPDAALAREFIEFVISPEGQKLWNWKVGTPGGPHKYALRRLPILPSLYAHRIRPSPIRPRTNNPTCRRAHLSIIRNGPAPSSARSASSSASCASIPTKNCATPGKP